MDHSEIVFNAILGRRSIRRFDTTRPVAKEKLEKLLAAAMAAPSACNIQPWEFIVLQDQRTVEAVVALARNGRYAVNTIIVVCGGNRYIPWKDHGVIDCSLAMGNMMTLAPLIGLGTLPVGGFDHEPLKALLGIPAEVEPICLLYVGYPEEHKKPRTKYLESAVHWDKYDASRTQEPRPGNVLVFGPEASL